MTRARPRVAPAPPAPADVECPYWHAVVNDWLWMVPTAGYCVAGPGAKVRVPSDATIARCCLTSRFGECGGFQRTAKRGGGVD